MFTEDTIAAISTPPGHSGIGIVRMSGRGSINIAEKIFVSGKKKLLTEIPSHKLTFGHIIDSDNKIMDEVLISVMRAPNTYTREDVVEINSHGGPVPLRRILELVLENGARLAEPGEFTQRAFLNGRLDLTQAEAVIDIINSLTEQSQTAAVEQLRGSLSKLFESIKEKLLDLTALVEANIDFPDEDIDLPSIEHLKKRAFSIKQSLKELIDSARYGTILREGLKTAIVGRPNVGKSSLLNALTESDRAIVTEMPGTTRDVIEEYLNIHGIPVKIMDTAGIRAAKDIAEEEGVKRSLRAMKDADLVLVVLDGSDLLHDTDNEIILKSDSKNTILVINKTDLPQKLVPPPQHLLKGGKADPHRQIVNVSAAKKTGLDELRNKIAGTALKDKTLNCTSGIVTNVRHLQALKRAMTSIIAFTDNAGKLPAELLAVELRDALDAIGEILGITTPEDVLNRIFRDFCIGK